MAKALISGLINCETTLKIDKFPIDYFPVTYPFFGINSSVSGVGFNVAKALKKLGDDVSLLSFAGTKNCEYIVKRTLESCGIDHSAVRFTLDSTPQSIIIYDPSGKRQIHVDLKDIQQQEYPLDEFRRYAKDSDLIVLCNINFSRPLLYEAKKMNKLIATDVHAISNVHDEYNADFMRYSDVLFFSDEHIGYDVMNFTNQVMEAYSNEIIVVGLGEKGSLLCVKADNFMEIFPAAHAPEIKNTIGAGDALFSAFVHFYIKNKNPYEALKLAQVFAARKISCAGGADGYIGESELLASQSFSNF